jgi:adenine C2-methylase RlmN of 23S rRNA A2503 and tRNA A37
MPVATTSASVAVNSIATPLSLHAPDDGLRSQRMPVNDRHPLAEVLAACDRYRTRRRRKVFEAACGQLAATDSCELV